VIRHETREQVPEYGETAECGTAEDDNRYEAADHGNHIPVSFPRLRKDSN
jgi:hypothetical protein